MSQLARQFIPKLKPLGKFRILLGFGGLMIPTGGRTLTVTKEGLMPEKLEVLIGNPQWLLFAAELVPA
jgi:hypothetical protein